MSEFACFLEREAWLELRGTNVPAFLQGQLTADMRRLTPQQAVAGALCNVKGRVLSDVCVILVDADRCLLRLRASMAEACATTLQRYAQFSRIAVSVAREPRSIAVIYSDAAFASRPGAAVSPLEVSAGDGILTLQRGAGCREHLLLDPASRDALAGSVAGHASGSEAAWRALMLRMGHFAIEADSSEKFTPQALNYDRTGLVAFDKGCYTGQEVVARLHYKGKSKRRLGILTLPSGCEVPLPGSDLFTDTGEKSATVLACEGQAGTGLVVAAEVNADGIGAPLHLASATPLHWVLPTP